jgi:hypothetical protein
MTTRLRPAFFAVSKAWSAQSINWSILWIPGFRSAMPRLIVVEISPRSVLMMVFSTTERSRSATTFAGSTSIYSSSESLDLAVAE